MFSGAPSTGDLVAGQSPRCKVFPIAKFRDSHWVINRWWTRDELSHLAAESHKVVTEHLSLIPRLQGCSLLTPNTKRH